MKKISLISSLALVALWLVPQTLNADCSFTPQVFPGQEAGRTDFSVDATIHVGDGGLGQANITAISSTDQTVVLAVDGGRSNYYVYGIAAGSATVSYTEQGRDGRNTCTTDHVINYTVQKGIPTIYVPAETYTIAWSQGGGGGEDGGAEGGAAGGVDGGGVVTGGGDAAGGGGGSAAPTPTIYTKELIMSGTVPQGWRTVAVPANEITYNSTNTAVAEINANGSVTIKGYGETTLSASWPGNTNWDAAVASYTLAVKKPANIYFSPSLISDTIDNVRKLAPVCPEGVTINRWQSMAPAVASVDDEGNVTMLKAGQVMIRAYFDGNDEYASAVCACQINISKKRPQIHFAESSIKLELNATPYVFPELIKPADLTNYYSWRSTSPTVASVDGAGNITIHGAGYTQIQYLYDQGETQHDPKYLPDIARLNLTVTTSGLYVGGQYVMSSNPDIFGDGSVVYSNENGETNLTLTNLNYNAGGQTFIQAVQSMNLNIYVVGNCHITNAAKAIETVGPLYIWCQNKKDTIHIDATHTAIEAGAMKVIDCYLFANGGQYGIYTNTFAVWAGGYIFAQGSTEAIRSYSFQRGMADMGGIEVLTKGVTFVEGTSGGFFTDYPNKVKAKYVEIGKIPLPLSSDEVKEIDFETENPYDNLDVVFSESKDDQFNEAEKQIEINTLTLEADITGAYTTYLTCSSEWLKLLPGVLVFDIPAGEGEAEIDCDIAAGKQLVVMIEGHGSVVFTATDGKVKIQYNITEQTHVIVYLRAEESSPSAPKRVAKAANDADPGVAIKSIKITPKDAPTAIESIDSKSDAATNKLLRNGQILILRDGKVYTVTGQEVR